MTTEYAEADGQEFKQAWTTRIGGELPIFSDHLGRRCEWGPNRLALRAAVPASAPPAALRRLVRL
jgi:hypothetical protein